MKGTGKPKHLNELYWKQLKHNYLKNSLDLYNNGIMMNVLFILLHTRGPKNVLLFNDPLHISQPLLTRKKMEAKNSTIFFKEKYWPLLAEKMWGFKSVISRIVSARMGIFSSQQKQMIRKMVVIDEIFYY